ncbi:MAG: tetratricopeptide repeat protein [Vicinamibacterales bacterium]
MAIDREATLKNAEKFLRVGRLDAAITEYARVVEDQPRDWATANTLGDLYVRAAQSDRAVALYKRIAEHLHTEGFYPKAAALYKKILKIAPEDEAAQIQLAEISVRQGLLANAKAYYAAVASRRRHRGDAAGADEIAIRLGAVDPADLSARLGAARALEQTGDLPRAAAHYRELYDELMEKGRDEDAAAALQDCVRCDPAVRDTAMLLPLAAIELRAGRLDAARALLPDVLARRERGRDEIVALAWTLADRHVEAAVLCVEAAADASIAAGELAEAAAILQEFATRVPGQIGTLLRLVEVSVDAGLEAAMYEAQAQLADAYLDAQRPDEARVIAEDLVAREPWDATHTDRLRRALQMLEVPDVDAAIAACVQASAPDPADALDDLPAAPPAESMPPAPASVPQPPAPRPAAPAPLNAEIDLTALLSELERPAGVPEPPARGPRPTRDLEEVFAGLRDEAGRVEDTDDSGEHMAIARSYMEMGTPEEAMSSLEIAARSPHHRFAAASALAHIYRDQSDLARAIDWFERAAEAPAPTPEEGYALLYDLGDVLDSMGETARALAVFLELAADAPGFRDVGARVTQLSNAGTEG